MQRAAEATLRTSLRLTALLLVLSGAPGLAQSNRADTRELLGGREAPEPAAPGAAPLALPGGVELPDVPQVRPEHRVTAVHVQRIEVSGVTLLDPASVAAALAPYEGRDLTLEEIQSAANTVTALYINAGFVSSGVLVPDQDASDGVIAMTAVEGRLDAVILEGNERLRDSYIEKRLDRALGDNLNVFELEQALRLMQQGSLVRQVNAQLVPGSERGASLLNLRIAERDALVLQAGYDNHRSPSVGEDQGRLTLAHYSLTGNGDYLFVNYANTDGADDYGLTYGFPLTAGDLTWEAYYSEGESDIVEQPFEELDILSEVTTWGTRLYRPVYRTLSHEVVVGLGFENTQTESFLLNEPFSFSPGEQDGQSEVSLLRLATEWTWRRTQDAFYTRLAVSQGVDWLDATDRDEAPPLPDGSRVDNLPDSDFTTFLLQTHYARALPWAGMQLLARLTTQVSLDPLLSSQKLAVGGARTVRGYRENQLVRDNGVIASVELRVPVWPDEAGNSRLGLTFVPFLDFGEAQDEAIDLPGLDDPESDRLLSVGGGLLWNGWQPLHLAVFYGEDLEDADTGGDSLQEDGVHVRAYLEWTF